MATKQAELVLIFMLTLEPRGPCCNPGWMVTESWVCWGLGQVNKLGDWGELKAATNYQPKRLF